MNWNFSSENLNKMHVDYNASFGIQIKKLEKSEKWYFGKKVNRFHCLIGRNGCGKTTLLKDIGNIVNETSEVFYIEKGKVVGEDYLYDLEVSNEKIIDYLEGGGFIVDKVYKNQQFQEKNVVFKSYHKNNNDLKMASLINTLKDSDFKLNYYFKNSEESLKEKKEYIINVRETLESKLENTQISDKEIYKNKKFKVFDAYGLRADFGCSSGELALISLYIALDTIFETKNNSEITLLIDEPETHLHPEWERTYINNLLQYIETKNKIVNIIIATHNPLILVDIPKNNITFLEKTDNRISVMEQKPRAHLGIDIDTIYRDDFFLSDTQGSRFNDRVKDLFEGIINIENSNKKNKNELEEINKYLSDIVGDPVLMMGIKKLSKMLGSEPNA